MKLSRTRSNVNTYYIIGDVNFAPNYKTSHLFLNSKCYIIRF